MVLVNKGSGWFLNLFFHKYIRNMSDTYNWATLDNSDAISIEEKSGYYTIKSGDGPAIDLMGFDSFKKVSSYKIWEEDQVYDNIVDAATDSGGRSATYIGLRISSSYFKSGELSNITYLRDVPARTDKFPTAETNNIIAVATYKNGIYTVKSYGVLDGTVTDFDTSSIKDGDAITTTLKVVKWQLETPVSLDKDLLNDSMGGIFLFSPVNKEDYPIGHTFSHDFVYENSSDSTIFNTLRILCMHRGLNDAASFCYEPASGWSSSSPDYIPFLEYVISTNNVEDHINDNFSKYHLDTDSISEISLTKYSAPFIESIKKINNVNATWNEIYISDKSLRGITYSDSKRIGRFSLNDSNISRIQIPLNFKYSWLTGYGDYYKKGLEQNRTDDYGILYLPMYLEIAFSDDEDATWYRSTNAISQNYPKNPTNYNEAADTLVNWEFNFEGVDAKYEGNGIWIRPFNGERLNYDENSGDAPNRLNINDLAISLYQSAVLNDEDYINLHKAETTFTDGVLSDINWVDEEMRVTAPVKIFFDYNLRAAWNELVDNHLYENELIKYDTFEESKILSGSTPGKAYFNKSLLNGECSPASPSSDLYLYTVTFVASGAKNHLVDRESETSDVRTGVSVYLALYDAGTNKITYSKNSLQLNGTTLSPTWIFDEDERTLLYGNDITLVLSENNTQTNISEVGKGLNEGVHCTVYPRPANNTSKIMHGDDFSGSSNNVPAIIFGFKSNKIKNLEYRISALETALANHLS